MYLNSKLPGRSFKFNSYANLSELFYYKKVNLSMVFRIFLLFLLLDIKKTPTKCGGEHCGQIRKSQLWTNRVYATVNTEMLNLYWNIGKAIMEIQQGDERASYGKTITEINC